MAGESRKAQKQNVLTSVNKDTDFRHRRKNSGISIHNFLFSSKFNKFAPDRSFPKGWELIRFIVFVK